MADQLRKETKNIHFEDLEPLSPGVDYGLKNVDGFDPSKYDFYNPSYRTVGKAFVVRLDEYVLHGPPPPLVLDILVVLIRLQKTTSCQYRTLRLQPDPF